MKNIPKSIEQPGMQNPVIRELEFHPVSNGKK